MSREIKFRAWDKEEKVMIPVCGVLPLQGILVPDGETKVGDFGAYQKNYKYRLADKIVIMQYTGLKDKNGKEIYEGDIVEWKYLNTWQRNEVKWVQGGFVSTMTAFKNDLNEMQNLSLISKLDCEIIGNIYEHPHLLENK